MGENKKQQSIREFFKRLSRGTLKAGGVAGGVLASLMASTSTTGALALTAGGSILAVLAPLFDEIIFGTLDDKTARKEKKKLDQSLFELEDRIKDKIDEIGTDIVELLVDQCEQNKLNNKILSEIKKISALVKNPESAPISTSLEETLARIVEKKNDEQTKIILESDKKSAKILGGKIEYNTILLVNLIQILEDILPSFTFSQEKHKIHNIPYPSIGDLFKGRDDILKKLKAHLDNKKATAITQAIEGLGGIGKTRLAIEFAWWFLNKNKDSSVFVISSETPELMWSSLAALAGQKLLNLPGQKQDEQIQSVFKWLNTNAGWLMIFDNADTKKSAEAIENLLPQLANGRVIITSRYKLWSGAIKPHSLELLNPKQALQFLLDRTDSHRIKSKDDKKSAGQLAEQLGYLPLALEQAGAYIEYNQCNIADYLNQWETERKKVLEWLDKRLMQYPFSVAVTLQRTFDQLDPLAQTLLHIIAFLAPELIPSEMFKQSIDVVQEAIDLLTGDKQSKNLKLEIDDALAELAAYSMITRQDKGFTVHRIVQEVIRSRIANDAQRNWIQKSLDIVNNYAPNGPDDVRTWPIYDILRPHAELIVNYSNEVKITEPTSRLMNQLGLYFKTKGLFSKAEPLYLRSLKIEEASLGKDHPKIAIHLNNLSILYRETNRLKEAEPLMKRALKINEASFGNDHPKIAIPLNNLAQLYQDTGHLKEAEPLMKRALKIDEASFGKDHPSVARDLNNLAMLYKATDRLKEAEPLMQRVIKIFKKALGDNHPNVAAALNNLAQLLQATNRLTEAEPLMKRALKIDESSFGKDHPIVAIDINNLAQLYHATRRFKEAEPLMERALKIDESSFGKDHPKVAIRFNNLALLYKFTNRLKEAEPMYRRALKIFEASLGPDHPSTKTVRGNLETLLKELKANN
ncbi:MAG: tetratricopeptide repeat protein [Sedimentisphaerales bacterium]|nr:tetratricopeptide repeat protein [Sedimentisphaerales bacterium]